MSGPIQQELFIRDHNEECSISLESFHALAARKELVVTSCGHKFSRVAITDWLEKNGTCPNCRKKSDKNELIDVVLATNEIAKNQLQSSSSSSTSRPIDRLIDARTINGDLMPEEALQAALKASLKGNGILATSSSLDTNSKQVNNDGQIKLKRQASIPARKLCVPKEEGALHFVHSTLYEVVLVRLSGQSAKTFVSYDFLKGNKELRLENARPGDVFIVPGYFLNDWNNRISHVNRSQLYLFEPTRDDLERKKKLIAQGMKARVQFYSGY